MRHIGRPTCGSVGAAQGGTGSCDVCDPGPASTLWSAPGHAGRKREEDDDAVAGWLTEGPFVSLSRCGGVRCVTADGRVRLVSGCARERVGEAWLGKLGWSGQAGLLLLPPFPFLFLFVSLFFLLL